MSNFKELIDHYKTLSNDDLIEKLVLKNAKLLAQDKEIERLGSEITRLEEIDKGHQKLNGELSLELNNIKKSQQPEGVTNEN